MTNKIFLGSDHAGYEIKEYIKNILSDLSFDFEDLGAFSSQPSVDYPDIASRVSELVLKEKSFGILICGSGTGMSIAANRFKGIRAVLGYDEYSARMGRIDNDANILCLRAREFDKKNYLPILEAFFRSNFSSESRHLRRIKKLDEL